MGVLQRHRRPRHLLSALVGAAVILLTAAGSPPATSAVASDLDAPVTLMAAGDIGGDVAGAMATGDLIRAGGPSAVLALGDNAYPNGAAGDYATKYQPAWGSFKDRTHPVPGNHEYVTPGAAGYVGYFGAAAVTNPVDGGLYYAWDAGNGWRAYAVNTEISTTGAQLTWLREDLVAHPAQHYVLYTHHPRFTSGVQHAPSTAVCPLWNALAATGRLEIVLSGHNHQYERFAPMDCAGQASADGPMSFVAGSGGAGLYVLGAPQPGSQFRNDTDLGVLRLVLHTTSFEWSFLAAGKGATGAASPGTVLDGGTWPTDSTPSTPNNVAPTVDAGPDLTTALPASAAMNGTVTDDGLPVPPAAVTSSWSAVSGPGTVTFAAAASVDTTAAFSAPGTYVLRLSATDSALSSQDTVTVTVAPASSVEVRVTAGADDAEQKVNGSTTLTSTDLELIADGSTQQVVGIRFPGLKIPPRAKVTAAWVQFQVDEVSTGLPSSLTIRLETAVNPPSYIRGTKTITSRAVTGAITWLPTGWPTVGAAGLGQRTPDLASLIQVAVDRAGWASGNAVALQLSGTGRRTAEAVEGYPPGAPLLHVEFTGP